MKIPYNEFQLDIFNQPARIIVAGCSNSGKTELVTRLCRKYEAKFDSIIICGVANHPIEHLKLKSKVTVTEEIINPFDHTSEETTNLGLLYVLDDCFLEAATNKYVVDAFTKGRHYNISTILITQNLFLGGKHCRTIGLNASHYILMRNRDGGQILNLGRQIFGKKQASEFYEIYKRALSLSSYGYLLVDLAPNVTEALQFRTNIVDEPPFEIVFQW